jgi:cation:H+ antiporter
MSTTQQDLHHVHPTRQRINILLAVLATAPALSVIFLGLHPAKPVAALIFGAAIVGSAFLLSWAAEVAQLDISAGLALAVLALIAVLPEYAVDFVFAWQGGESFEQYGSSCPPLHGGTESPCSLALANMTGANRLLIGVGWSMVVFIVWYRTRTLRKKREAAAAAGTSAPTEDGVRIKRDLTPSTGIQLARQHSVEVSFLAIATIYSLFLPLKHSITLIDAVVLVGIFVAYTIRVAKAPAEEPHLVGPARYIGGWTARNRRIAVGVLYLVGGGWILL